MKRFHIHVGVKNISEAVGFYSALFGQKPTKLKDDYAKWMLEDPKLNFAISTRVGESGVDHLGIQVEEDAELEEITQRMTGANVKLFDQGDTTCCYSESRKAWVQDPSGIAWEAYRNMGDAEVFKGKSEPKKEETAAACCAPKTTSKANCC